MKLIIPMKLIGTKLTSFIKNYWIFIIIIAVYSSFYLFPNILFNPTSITSSEMASEVLSVLPSVLASIIALIIAVVILVVEFIKKNYSDFSIGIVFKNKYLKELAVYYFIVIFLSLLTITQLKVPMSHQNINQFNFSFVLFLIAIFSVYWYLKRIIGSTGSKEYLEGLIRKLDVRQSKIFGDYQRYKHDFEFSNFVEKNELYLLSEVLVGTIKSESFLTSNTILSETLKRYKFLLKGNPAGYRRDILSGFVFLLNKALDCAIQRKNYSIVDSILYTIVELHQYCAIKKVIWGDLIELNILLDKLISNIIRSDLVGAKEHLFVSVEMIAKSHLKHNVPDESEIWSLNSKIIKPDYDISNHWEHIKMDYLYLIRTASLKAIQFNDDVIAADGARALVSIAGDVSKMKNLGELQKDDLIKHCYINSSAIVLEAAKEGIYKNNSIFFPFHAFTLSDFLDRKAAYSKMPLLVVGETLIGLAEKSSLQPYNLNEWGAEGRQLIEKINGDILYTQAVKVIISVLNKIYACVNDPKDDDDKRLYMECYRQITSLEEWMSSKGVENKEILAKIKKLVKKFTGAEKIKAETMLKRVEWPK